MTLMRWVAAWAGVLAVTAWPATGRADERAVCADSYVAAQVKQGEHKLLAAREALRTCARRECEGVMRGQIIKDCARWLAQVEAAIPSVVLWAKTAAGDDQTDVTVSVDQVVVATKLDGRAIEVEPGSHVFTFEAPGGRKVTLTAVVLEGTHDQRIEAVLPANERAAPAAQASDRAPAGAPASPSGGAQVPVAEVRPATRGEGGSEPESAGSRPWPYVAFGVGATGLAVGAIFGVIALSTKSSLGHECTGNACIRGSQGDVDALHVQSWVSNVGFGVAAAGAVTGLALMLLAPGRPAPVSTPSAVTVTPWLGAGVAGIAGGFR